MTAMFRSLRVPNYRLWFAGALVSNTGGWMQRTAQDWIVLTELSDFDAAAVGITMALQFGPLLLLMPLAGLIADRFSRRIVLICTQTAQGIFALGLGLLVVTGLVELWHVYVFALLLGIAHAIDSPTRASFVTDLVPDEDLQNAVALNSTSFQSARVIGPAVAGVLIAAVGTGPVFLINAASFAAVLASLALLRRSAIREIRSMGRSPGQIREGFRYVRNRSDILVVLTVVFLVGTFGFNVPIFISTMATIEFHRGAAEFGLLSSVLAVGSVSGALLAARQQQARFGVIVLASCAFGLACTAASLSPTYLVFGIALAAMGITSLSLVTTANAFVQTRTAPNMRGRVMALYMAIFAGGTPVGAPIVGAVANTLGPRWALGIGALSGFISCMVAVVWLIVSRGMRLTRSVDARFGMRLQFRQEREAAAQAIASAESTTKRTG